MNNQKFYLAMVALVVLVGGGLTYYFVNNKTKIQTPVACTMEAKFCPDGSSVGRTGVNCEFADCPVISTTTDETAGWKTFTDSEVGYEYEYPEKFGANVWSATFWPPKVTVFSTREDLMKVGCTAMADAENKSQMQKRTFNNIEYSYFKASGVGAGSLYNTYCYVTEKDNKNYAIEFAIRSHTGCNDGQCGAYCDTPNEEECRQFDLTRDVEMEIEKIVTSFKFITLTSGVATTTPSISSVTPDTMSVGEEVVVVGNNFSGFEGDKTVWITDSKGVKGIIFGDASSTASVIKFKLPVKACQSDTSYSGLPCPAYLNLVPGVYNIYTYPWGVESNKVNITIK